MKRKQFHLSQDEEVIPQRISEEIGSSKAKIVREAIKEYGRNN